MLPVIIF